jgi:hypothetical protein
MTRKKKKPIRSTPTKAVSSSNWWSRHPKPLLLWLGSTGMLVAMTTAAYQYFFSNVNMEFLQSVGRGYEFQLKNDSPADWIVRSFRVIPPNPQQVIYRITEDVYADQLPSGQLVLPGGNVSYVPAAEFHELDGQRVQANSATKFRMPPLSSRTWMEPVATIVNIEFELVPSNRVLAGIEWLLSQTGMRSNVKSKRYLVVDNYWIVSNSDAPDEALRVACRDNDSLARTSSCK